MDTANAVAPPASLPADFLARAKALLGPQGWSEDAAAIAPRLQDWRGRGGGHTPFMAMPSDTREVSEFLKLCHAWRIPVTPQGGNTGLVDGGIPHGEVLLTTARMNRVRAVDPLNNSMVVDSGTVLTAVHDAAAAADRFFPLSLGSQGSATLGGLISTNAGGVAVLRYGMMRDLILGLEVVLADGQVWNGLTGLRKNNTGYDLRHLFAGAEGTLGVITAANLKLFPIPAKATAWAIVPSPKAAVELLAHLRKAAGDTVTSFELIPANAVAMVLSEFPSTRDPLPHNTPWRVLIELSMADESHARDVLEEALAGAIEAGLVEDVAIAQSLAQSQGFWLIREIIPMSKRAFGAVLAHDISVPVSAIPDFLSRCESMLAQVAPGSVIVAFGHVGDGNLHYSVCVPGDGDTKGFLARKDEITGAVHDLVCAMGGSISAEHGIGREKREENEARKPAVEMAMMRAIKTALDPLNLMNPGRVVAI